MADSGNDQAAQLSQGQVPQGQLPQAAAHGDSAVPGANSAAYLDTIAATVPLFAAAMEAHRQGQITRARGNYIELMDQPWLTAVCLHQLAILAGQVGDHSRAADLLRHATRLDPMQGLFHQNLSATLERLGRPAEALEALMEYGVTLQKANLHEAAIPVYRKMLATDPCRYGAYINMGTGFATIGRTREAVEALLRGIALYARLLPEARALLDAILPELIAAGTVPPDTGNTAGMPTGRIEVLEHALASLGKALNDLDHVDAALAAYRMAVTIDPGLALGHWNLSLALLAKGDFENGWREYEWRWHWDRFPEPKRLLQAPFWRGEPVARKRIGVYAEQGFGDIIQFAPLATKLAQEAGEVVLEVPTPLVRLFRQSFEGDKLRVVARTENPNFLDSPAPLDFAVPLLSLPHRLSLRRSDLPLAQSYLRAAEPDRLRWEERLQGLKGRKVGLVWAGRAAYADDSKRSMTLEQFRPLFDLPGNDWVSLQVGPRRGDAGTAGIELFDAPAFIDDFADTAAAISALDLVIAVDTGVAHLAAALGKPVWILLPKVADWRWLASGTETAWYPTVRLFRQTRPGDWSEPLAALHAALARGAIAAPAAVESPKRPSRRLLRAANRE